MKIRCAALLLVLPGVLASEAVSQTYYSQEPPAARRLGILGGLAGAGIGAAIGEDDGDAVPGAIIGGAIGAISGAAVGSAADQNRARQQQAYLQAQQAQQARLATAVTLSDVVSMTRAGLGDEVIITHIRTHGLAQPLSANDLIVLKQQGVSDRVLYAMQNPPAPTTVVRPQPAPVIVEEHYYGRPTPAWYYHRHHHHRHRPYRPQSRVHFGFHFD